MLFLQWMLSPLGPWRSEMPCISNKVHACLRTDRHVQILATHDTRFYIRCTWYISSGYPSHKPVWRGSPEAECYTEDHSPLRRVSASVARPPTTPNSAMSSPVLSCSGGTGHSLLHNIDVCKHTQLRIILSYHRHLLLNIRPLQYHQPILNS